MTNKPLTISEIEKELSKVSQQPFDMAILESKDFKRGFRQGFEVCWNKMLDKLKALKGGEKK